METTQGSGASAPENEKKVTLEYRMRFWDLYGFSLRQALTGLNGCAYWLVLALLVWRMITGFAEDKQSVRILLIGAVILLVVVMPANMALRTAQALRMAAQYQNDSVYTVSAEGIFVKQGEAEELVEWSRIRKVRESRRCFYAYVLKNSAFIFPKELLGEDTETLRELLQAYAGKSVPDRSAAER
ncbi:MAG: YcxB family protein [Lachnospiraceae bacterium]|nr:YcxB family protein [Lachnospiraceae bacterium]